MPPSLLWTVPDPAPAFVTDRMGLNVAVTDRSSVIDTAHVAFPEHAPDQAPKLQPVPGVAVSVTDVPWRYVGRRVNGNARGPVREVAVLKARVLIAPRAISLGEPELECARGKIEGGSRHEEVRR